MHSHDYVKKFACYIIFKVVGRSSKNGGGERGIFNLRDRGQACSVFWARGSGGDEINYIARIRRGPLERENGASVTLYFYLSHANCIYHI